MNTVTNIFGLSLLLIFNPVNAENIRIPIKSGSNGTVTVDTSIPSDGTEHRMNSVSGGFSSTGGHRANATVNIKKGDGSLNYTHKKSNGIVTFGTNFSSEGKEPRISSVSGGFSSKKGHRANATVNTSGSGGIINYTHKKSNGIVTFHTNFLNDGKGSRMSSVGGGFSNASGHGVSATLNTIGSGGTINYTHTNDRTKLKFSGGVSNNNGYHGSNLWVQIPFDIK